MARLALPSEMREEALSWAHSENGGAHFGEKKAATRFASRFWFPGWRKSLARYVADCDDCATAKAATRLCDAPLSAIEATEPGHTVHMDTFGPLDKSRHGFQHVLIMVDGMSRFAQAVALTKTTAAAVCNAVRAAWLAPFGAPRRLVLDRAAAFESRKFKELADSHAIELVFTPPHDHRSNGKAESFAGTLQTALRANTQHHAEDWERYLDSAVMSYNTTAHTATSATPFSLFFGRSASADGPGRRLTVTIGESAQHVEAERRVAVRQSAASAQRSKERHAKKAHMVSFSVGEMVKMKRTDREPGVRNSLRPLWVPVRVSKVLGSGIYEVLEPEANVKYVRKVTELQPLKATAAPAESTGSEREYAVAAIKAHRGAATSREYLVRWKGNWPRHLRQTWEPVGALDGCQELLSRYNKANGLENLV
jgi:hypothetical protein